MSVFLCICCGPLFLAHNLAAYNLPFVNLGFTNILDGGLRQETGWYFRPYLSIYTTKKFTNDRGKLLGGVPSPCYNNDIFILQFIYTSNKEILSGKLGFNFFLLPFVLFSQIGKNRIGITTSGSGMGDLLTGVYVQWPAITLKGQSSFVMRLEMDASFPIGKYNPHKLYNPGNNFYFINPYWAATFYLTTDLAISWRLHYLWNSKNKATQIQAGDAVHLNYDIEYQIIPKLWLGLVGYFLQQLHNSKKFGIDIPNSKERILGIGAGALYMPSEDLDFFTYLYFEKKARNRPQGIQLIFRLIKHF